MSKSKGKAFRVSEIQRKTMINLEVVQSRKKRRTREVDEYCASDSIDVPVELPRLDSGSRAPDELADTALDPALPVECELPTKLKKTREAAENERKCSADEMPVSPTKKMESVHFRSDWKNAKDAMSCAESSMRCAIVELKDLERKQLEAETEIRRLEFALAQEKSLRNSCQIGCEEQMRKVMSLEHDRDAALLMVQKLESTLSILKIAENDSKQTAEQTAKQYRGTIKLMHSRLRKLEREGVELKRKETSMLAEQVKLKRKETRMLADQLKIKAERDKLTQKAEARDLSWTKEKATLQNELHEERNTVQAMLAEQLKIKAERDKLIQKADARDLPWTKEKATLQNELHAERNTVQAMLAEQLKIKAERDKLIQKADARNQSWTNEKAILQSELHELRNTVQATLADQLKLVAERDGLKQEADAQNLSWTNEKANLQRELDAAQIAMEAKKTEFDSKLEICLREKKDAQEFFEKLLISVESERDDALVAVAQQKALVLKCNATLEIALLDKKIALEERDIRLVASTHRCSHDAMNEHEN